MQLKVSLGIDLKMKILHVVPSLFKNGGGTSEVVPRLCRALRECGHEVTLAALRANEISDMAKDAIKAGVRYEGESERVGWLPKSLGYSSSFRSLMQRLVAESDVVHVHCLWQMASWVAAKEALRQGKPYVVMPHGFLEPERLKISKWKKRIVGALADRPMLNRANAVIATSESEEKGIRRYGVKRPIHIVPIGLDLEKYRQSKCNGRTLLYFSRITPIKGLDMLAEVWGRMDRKGWKLLIVGPDDRGYTDKMKRLFALKCPSESYEFRSPVFGDGKYALLSSVDAFILPTRSENWSIAVAEAMASGLPVVCTKGAPWECLDTVHAGWWVEVSCDGIQSGLERLFELSAAERKKHGRNGVKWVGENLDWHRIVRRMQDIYAALMAGRGNDAV